jgi:hypothetical protein
MIGEKMTHLIQNIASMLGATFPSHGVFASPGRRAVWRIAGILVVGSAASVQGLTVVSVSPARNVIAAPVNSAIAVEFDKPVVESSAGSGSFWAFGRWSGPVDGTNGTYDFSNGGKTVTLTPNRPFSAGERVMVILSHDLEATDATLLRDGGYSYQFWTATQPATLTFSQIQALSVRTNPGDAVITYGGVGSDFNHDGYLDLGMVTEVAGDFRVFLNKANDSGQYQTPFVSPPSSLEEEASPNEPSDFNRDGNVDVCIAIAGSVPPRVSVLLGNGDGTFQAQQIIEVGLGPFAVAVLDADGDGDIDIANTNQFHNGTGSVSLLVNDGSGVFGAPVHMEAGADGERGLAAADMNNDGILDLVVGTRNTEKVIVMLGNGDGTFTPQPPVTQPGSVWMLETGDVNGDGNEDVVCANSGDEAGSTVLLGDGNGDVTFLQDVKHTQVGVGPDAAAADRSNAVDLCDLDGDGVLEWVVSSFGGRFWRLFENDGLGNSDSFTLHTHWNPPEHAACCIAMDVHNDGRLDLVQIEETTDQVFIMANIGGPNPSGADCDGDGDVDGLDFAVFASCFNKAGNPPRTLGCPPTWQTGYDFDDDGDIDGVDFSVFAICYNKAGNPPRTLGCPQN